MQDDVAELEYLGILVRLVGANHQPGIVADELVHDDLDLALMPGLGRVLLPDGFGRDVDYQALHMHRTHVRGLQEQTHQPGMKLELLHHDERILCARGDHIVRERRSAAPCRRLPGP